MGWGGGGAREREGERLGGGENSLSVGVLSPFNRYGHLMRRERETDRQRERERRERERERERESLVRI